MKRILMLTPHNCGAGDTKKNKIYDILEDYWYVYNENDDIYPYTKEISKKHPKGARYITIKDESSTDNFEVKESEDRFIILENDKQLAHELIERIDGLDIAIINMALHFGK
jgi:hypothetical protein